MHQPLETYLNRIKSQLKGIPGAERELQIQEITQHLYRMIADQMASGFTEADAVRAAIAQFGEPKEIGRSIKEAFGGTKTSVWLGMAMGALVGVAILKFFWVMPLFFGMPYGTTFADSNVSFNGRLVEMAISGALASLVGRRFTWRYLMRPSSGRPIFCDQLRIVVVCRRFWAVGMLRGGIGGAIYTFCDSNVSNYVGLVRWSTYFPTEPNPFRSFLNLHGLLFWVGLGAVTGALLVGYLNALVGAGLRVRERRAVRHRKLA